MSSSDDSEAAEWEREQMSRGTQSNRQKCRAGSNQPNSGPTTIDPSIAKNHINQDVERAELSIKNIRKKIGTTRLELVKSEKRLETMQNYIKKLESSKAFFDELSRLKEDDEIIECFHRYQLIIAELPSDQRDLIETLERKVQKSSESMDVDG